MSISLSPDRLTTTLHEPVMLCLNCFCGGLQSSSNFSSKLDLFLLEAGAAVEDYEGRLAALERAGKVGKVEDGELEEPEMVGWEVTGSREDISVTGRCSEGGPTPGSEVV